MAQEIDRFGSPRTLSPLRTQELVNQSRSYVQGAQAAAATREQQMQEALVPNEQTIQRVAGSGPASTAGPGAGGGGNALRAGVPGVQNGSPGVLSQMFPGTAATLRGTGEDLSAMVDQGRFAAGAGRLVRNTFGVLPIALADDVVGGAARALRQPAANFLGGFTGSEPTVPTGQPAASRTAPVSAPVAGAGRDAKALTGDFSRPATDRPGYDFTKQLNAVPRELPTGLRENAIYATSTRPDGKPNVFSGVNVKEGAGYVNGRSEPLRMGGGTVSTVPGMSKEQIAEVMARPSNFNPNMTAAQNIQYNREVENAQRVNAASQIIESRANRGGLRGPTGVSGPSGNVGIDRLRDFAGRGDVSLGTLRALSGAEGEMRGQNVTMRGQDINADVTMRGQDMTQTATLRGQDITARGQDMTARTAREAALRDQLNRDREFGLNLTKEERAARESAQTQLDKTLDTFATVRDKDGKPTIDPDMRRRSAEAVNAIQGRAIQAALAAGKPQLAAQIQKQGAAGIDQDVLRQTLRTMEIQKAAKADDGWTPWSGDYVDSDNPEDFKPKLDANGKPVIEEGLLWDKAVLRGGSRVNPNALKKFGDDPTRRYDNLR